MFIVLGTTGTPDLPTLSDLQISVLAPQRPSSQSNRHTAHIGIVGDLYSGRYRIFDILELNISNLNKIDQH